MRAILKEFLISQYRLFSDSVMVVVEHKGSFLKRFIDLFFNFRLSLRGKILVFFYSFHPVNLFSER
ncbi:hypothetical protein WH95_15270 [Kiloniella litopenaei]|uniref:Uncharacterized protein n=1 Tax=Kiloniella litopenaei TaxID=1549748 RepID=A0A0M2R943_9PROT|nr:hypothetical protein WH95_15270 [Kiloniella litopenaei]